MAINYSAYSAPYSLPGVYFTMPVVQPASLNQFKLFYKLTSGADVWLDWGYGSPVKLTADGTEKFTATSNYPTNNTTYNMRLYGEREKILEIKFTEATSIVVNGDLSEMSKLPGLEILYLGVANNWVGDITELPSTLKEFYWSSGLLTGSTDDLPTGLTKLYILSPSYETGVSGTLDNLPAGLTELTLNQSNSIKGETIPAGVTYLHLNGLRNISAGGNITVNIDDFNDAMTYCYLNDLGNGTTGSGFIQGDFANFPRSLTMLWMDNVGQLITGDSDNLPTGLITFACMDMTTSNIYIKLNSLPATITNFELKDTPTGRVTGSLNSMPCRAALLRMKWTRPGTDATGNIENISNAGLYEFIINGNTNITYGGGGTPIWPVLSTMTIQTSMSGATVDSLIAALVASHTGTVTGVWTFSGARTAGSDANVSHLLTAHNKTVVTAA